MCFPLWLLAQICVLMSDHDRPLSKAGRADAISVSNKLQQMGWIPELILCRCVTDSNLCKTVNQLSWVITIYQYKLWKLHGAISLCYLTEWFCFFFFWFHFAFANSVVSVQFSNVSFLKSQYRYSVSLLTQFLYQITTFCFICFVVLSLSLFSYRNGYPAFAYVYIGVPMFVSRQIHSCPNSFFGTVSVFKGNDPAKAILLLIILPFWPQLQLVLLREWTLIEFNTSITIPSFFSGHVISFSNEIWFGQLICLAIECATHVIVDNNSPSTQWCNAYKGNS